MFMAINYQIMERFRITKWYGVEVCGEKRYFLMVGALRLNSGGRYFCSALYKSAEVVRNSCGVMFFTALKTVHRCDADEKPLIAAIWDKP